MNSFKTTQEGPEVYVMRNDAKRKWNWKDENQKTPFMNSPSWDLNTQLRDCWLYNLKFWVVWFYDFQSFTFSWFMFVLLQFFYSHSNVLHNSFNFSLNPFESFISHRRNRVMIDSRRDEMCRCQSPQWPWTTSKSIIFFPIC